MTLVLPYQGHTEVLWHCCARLVSVIPLTFSSCMRDGCRTQAPDPHTLLSESGTKVDTGMAYVLLGLLMIRREITFPESQ